MPVVLTVLDNIAAELVERLETLMVEGTEQTTVSEVVQPKRLGDYTPEHLQIVVKQANPERVPELDCPGNPPAECWRQQFNLYLHVRPSEGDIEPVDGIINRFCADVKKAVCTPASTWYTFGNYAIDAEWLTIENIDSGEVTDGVNMPIAITYRVSENDPYTVRA